jgi:glycosyltransferase involved in cell wall biosynthesis
MDIKGLISIIIPVYNAENFLEECINSVLSQTYQNIELILVDDGSSDNSWNKINEYTRKYKNIKGVQKINGGANSARKKGIEVALGEFVIFLDADDYIDERMCNKLLHIMAKEDVDIALSKLIKVLENKQMTTVDKWPQGRYSSICIAENIIDLQYFFKRKISSGLVAGIYKKNIVQKIFNIVDERIRFAEDYVCLLLLLLEVKEVYVLDEYLYYYRQNNTSAMHSYEKNCSESIKLMYKNIENELKKKNVSKKIYKQVKWVVISSLLIAGYEIFKEKEYLYPFRNVQRGSNIVIYGAGSFGGALHNFVGQYNLYNVVLWVDQNYTIYQEKGYPVYQVEEIDNANYDYIVIAIMKTDVSMKISEELKNRGYDSDKIVCIDQKLISYQELPEEFWLD